MLGHAEPPGPDDRLRGHPKADAYPPPGGPVSAA
jgi:hypothetical protein